MSLLYALMSTVASTLGNIVGYNIGRIGGKPLIEKLIKAKTLHLTQQMLHKYDVWATAIASFTPFPDKVFSLCAGAFSLNFKRFTLAIFFARAARFYLVSFLLFFYGASLREILLDHMGTIMLGLLALILVSSIVWKYFLRWFEKKLD